VKYRELLHCDVDPVLASRACCERCRQFSVPHPIRHCPRTRPDIWRRDLCAGAQRGISPRVSRLPSGRGCYEWPVLSDRTVGSSGRMRR
jgi:hypothetical protein